MTYIDRLKKQKKPVLLQFYADWCPPCRMLSPIVTQIADEYFEAAHVEKINVDQNPEIAAEFSVRSIPAMFIITDGIVAWQHVGFMGFDQLKHEIEVVASVALQ